jgi:hypothetical protein
MGPDFPFQLAHSTGSVTNPCSHLAGSGRLRAFYEHEPLNFFGYRPARVDIGEMSAKRRHSLIELRVGQARQEGIGTQCRFMDEAWPVRSDGFYDDLMVPRRKAGGDKIRDNVIARRQIGIEHGSYRRKKLWHDDIVFARPGAMQT